MAISTAQINAFRNSPEFRADVENVLANEASYKIGTNADNPEAEGLTPEQKNYHLLRLLYERQVVMGKADLYPVVYSIVTDSGWSLTFDAWEADREGARAAISGLINKYLDAYSNSVLPAS
jgi:hypothetical protein